MSMTNQTLETVRQTSAVTTAGTGGTVAAVKVAQEIEPTWVDWINENSILIGLGIALASFLVNTVTNVYMATKKPPAN